MMWIKLELFRIWTIIKHWSFACSVQAQVVISSLKIITWIEFLIKKKKFS